MSEQDHGQLNKDNVQLYARTGGALYLLIIVIGVLGEAAIRHRLIAWGDPAATAANILASAFLWRLGVAGQLLLLLCATGLTFIWYLILRPVNRNLTLMAMFFGLVSLAMEGVGTLYLHAALAPLTSIALQLQEPQQLHAMAYQAILSHAQAFGIALTFFGVQCLIVGYLIRQSDLLPKVLGTMMQIAGLCYITNSFCQILFPSLSLFPAILLPSFIGESAVCLWLLIKGVNLVQWNPYNEPSNIRQGLT